MVESNYMQTDLLISTYQLSTTAAHIAGPLGNLASESVVLGNFFRVFTVELTLTICGRNTDL